MLQTSRASFAIEVRVLWPGFQATWAEQVGRIVKRERLNKHCMTSGDELKSAHLSLLLEAL